MRGKTRTSGLVGAMMVAAICSVLASAVAKATTVDFSWSGAKGYSAAGQFTYAGSTAPTLISESGAGATNSIQSFSVSFFDPTRTLLESGSSVVGGVSSDRFFRLEYNTLTNTISVLDTDIGGTSYRYFLTSLRTPTGDVVPPGVTGFNFFDRLNADVGLDSALSANTVVEAVPEPSTLVIAATAAIALAFARRRGA